MNKKVSKELKDYMESNLGIFTSLGVFIALMILSTNEFNLISVGGFFISFILISYLLKEINIDNTWSWLLYLGYNLLFVGMLIYGVKNMLSSIGWLNWLVIACLIGFYGYVSISKLIQAIKLFG